MAGNWGPDYMFYPWNCVKGTRFGSVFSIMVHDVIAAWYLWALHLFLQSWNPGWTLYFSNCIELTGTWLLGVCHSLPSSLADGLSEGRVLRDLVGHGAGWADNPPGPHRFQKHSLRVSVHPRPQCPPHPAATPCVCTELWLFILWWFGPTWMSLGSSLCWKYQYRNIGDSQDGYSYVTVCTAVKHRMWVSLTTHILML